MDLKPSPRSAYIHVPFCARRCGYCNFTLIADRADLVDRYLDALELEFRSLPEPQTMDTIFWGGGTPTYLSSAQLDRLLELTHRYLPPASDCEWSCEANPLDCSADKLKQLRGGGVNRLSLGGQSFDDAKLKMLERDHTSSDLAAALERARYCFDNIAVDLIFASPNETIDVWLRDIEQTLKHAPQHISTYGLTIEQGAAFFGRMLRGAVQPVEESIELQMYLEAIDRLTSAGYEHYEVSNFALPGRQCRHNEAYWLGRPWLAFGPGAAGFDGRVRTVNHRSTTTYIKKIMIGESPVFEREELDKEQQFRERFVFGLRRLEGVDLADLEAGFEIRAEALLEPALSRAVAGGWLQRDGTWVRLSRSGLVVSDALWPDFLS
ncbi:MAG: radical SAM family heme chaperone HemW [Pirellulales bacterium]